MTRRNTPLRVAVLGAGRMGAALAVQYAQGGHAVTVTTSVHTSAEQAAARIREAAGGSDVAASRIRWAASTEEACRDADIVIESLPEHLTTKQEALARAQRVAPHALLGTNTSSLEVTEIARGLDDPSTLAGTHYLNPPGLFRVMELVPGEQTHPSVLDRFTEILTELGLSPVRLRRDAPGFVINRLQFALLREAAELVDSGVVTAGDLDRLVAEGLAPRWVAAGPLTTALLGGGSLFDDLAGRLYPALSRRTALDDSVVKHHPDSDTADRMRRDRGSRLQRVLDVMPTGQLGAEDPGEDHNPPT